MLHAKHRKIWVRLDPKISSPIVIFLDKIWRPGVLRLGIHPNAGEK